MSKVEGGGVRLTPPPLKALCNYFFLKASRVKHILNLHKQNLIDETVKVCEVVV